MALKLAVFPVVTAVAAGVIATVMTGAVTVTEAVSDFVASATLVALTWKPPAEAGAV